MVELGAMSSAARFPLLGDLHRFRNARSTIHLVLEGRLDHGCRTSSPRTCPTLAGDTGQAACNRGV
jgi:hypothetical protein